MPFVASDFEEMAADGVKYLEENREREGVNITESGLQFRVITQGEGAIPARTNHVRVHYTGKLIDGTVFDSSVARGEPAEFPVNGVIPGWIEALTLMPVGSKWELTIPQNLAYGERGAGASIPPFQHPGNFEGRVAGNPVIRRAFPLPLWERKCVIKPKVTAISTFYLHMHTLRVFCELFCIVQVI